MKRFLFILMLISPIILFSQSSQDLTVVRQVVETYGACEKSYVHTDRDYYTGGGDIYFKVYLTDATLHQEKARSKVAYVDLLDENKKIVQSRIIAIQDGYGMGDFQITSKYKSGNYILRAYTEYMKNFDTAFFFRKTIYIRSVTNVSATEAIVPKEARMQFFPEGGDLVDGLASKVGVKFTNESGFGGQITGEILDATQQKIADISTNESGFGQFSVTPKKGQTYTFEGIYNGQKLKATLPTSLKEGAVLTIDNSEEEEMRVQINTNIPTDMTNGYLIGQAMGKVFFKEKISKESSTNFELNGFDIPIGVLHFTLFDNQGRPRAERLVFNHTGIDDFNVDISADKAAYKKREKVQLKLDVYDDNGEVIPTDLSMSVRNSYLERATANNDNIQSYLLLSSDIKGVIENPTAYFKDNEKATKAKLDLLLMTQGWRRFLWQDVLKTPVKKLLHEPEKSLSLAGKITRKEDINKPVKAVGYLSELSANLSMIDFETNETGQFAISGLQTNNNTEMVLQAAILDRKQEKVKKGSYELKGNRNINIEVGEKIPPPVSNKLVALLDKAKQAKENYTSLSNLENISYKNDLSYGDEDFSIEIDSVEVTATKIDKIIEYYEDGMLYTRPDSRVKFDEDVANPHMHNDVLSILIGRVPGVVWDFKTASIIIRGKKSGLSRITQRQSARFMVNGAYVSDDYAMSINPSNIAFMDVLRSASQLTIYGEAGKNGIIMLYLKMPQDIQRAKKKEVPGISNFTFKGYHQARVFYAPIYTELNRTISKADNRVTLHWAPTIQFNDLGEAFVEFFTSDRVGTYDVVVEGLSKNGLPIFATSKIIVE